MIPPLAAPAASDTVPFGAPARSRRFDDSLAGALAAADAIIASAVTPRPPDVAGTVDADATTVASTDDALATASPTGADAAVVLDIAVAIGNAPSTTDPAATADADGAPAQAAAQLAWPPLPMPNPGAAAGGTVSTGTSRAPFATTNHMPQASSVADATATAAIVQTADGAVAGDAISDAGPLPGSHRRSVDPAGSQPPLPHLPQAPSSVAAATGDNGANLAAFAGTVAPVAAPANSPSAEDSLGDSDHSHQANGASAIDASAFAPQQPLPAANDSAVAPRSAAPVPTPLASNPATAASDSVRFLRELGPARAVQRLAVDLDGATVALRIDHGSAGAVVRINVVDDPAGRLDAGWTNSVERTLAQSLNHQRDMSGEQRRRNEQPRSTDEHSSSTSASRWAGALTGEPS